MTGNVKLRNLDPVIIGCYIFLIIFGWMNIYASSCQETGTWVFESGSKYAMQLIWIGSALAIDLVLLLLVPKSFYNMGAWLVYGILVALLMVTIFLGKEVNGSKSWLVLGPLRLQPAEFSKIGVTLALCSIMEKYTFSFTNRRDVMKILFTLAVPALLILLQKETGLILVYAGFFLVFFREGMSGWVLASGILAIALFIFTLIFSPYTTIVIWIGLVFLYAALYSRRFWLTFLIGAAVTTIVALAPGLLMTGDLAPALSRFKPETWLAIITLPVAACIITVLYYTKDNPHLRLALTAFAAGLAFILSCDFAFNSVLQDHQRLRIEQLLGIKDDPMGAGYNVHQSMIAIGSGGFAGKGFTQGTQTKFDFVPEQSTDFIFCTVGEEWGFIGSLVVIICYGLLIIRLYSSAEKQKDKFNRVFGYCVASCILVHVVINIGMTIGLMPVIGIPLPMLSYGGSSLWVFSILIFVYLRLDLESKW